MQLHEKKMNFKRLGTLEEACGYDSYLAAHISIHDPRIELKTWISFVFRILMRVGAYLLHKICALRQSYLTTNSISPKNNHIFVVLKHCSLIISRSNTHFFA